MIYALIADEEQPLTHWVRGSGDNKDNMKPGYYAHVMAKTGTIVNIIVYDGKEQYEVPKGLRLSQVADDAQIGDTGY